MRVRLTRGAGKKNERLSVEPPRWRKMRAVFVTMALMLVASAFLQPTAGAGPAQAPASTAPATAPNVSAVAVDSTTDAKVRALLVTLAQAKPTERKPLLQDLAKTGDQRLAAVFKDFSEGSLYVWKEQVVSSPDMEKTAEGKKIAPLIDPLTRLAVQLDGNPARVAVEDLKPIDVTGRDRVLARDALSLLQLFNPDREARLNAVVKSGSNLTVGNLPALEELAKTEKAPAILTALRESIALIHLATPEADPAAQATRMEAAKTLGDMRSARALAALQELQKTEKDPDAKKTLETAIARIQNWQTVVEWAGNIFSGLSLSSVLILMALGLAIIFGLMGVINMAHGELMMIGAYATFKTQVMFAQYFPGAMDWFFIAAIPLAFLAAALVGMLIEATIIRFLYGRPLDTLLATLGVSFILIQLIRIQYGDNRAVNSPTWLQGSLEIAQDIRLPYNRLFIMGFCILCIALMYYIVDRTKLGLLLRATTQNRAMAASLGVSTRKIDMLTFGLGWGLAGMAGCALTQIGGISPDMGQNYVIDSFLVVVVGGVGKLAGAIWSGLGLGMVNKFMEPVTGTVWAKVIILVLVVAFIQRKPSGLFPAKGRLADV